MAERTKRPFASLADFQLRTALGKPALRALAKIGALNGLAEHRRDAQWHVETVRDVDDLFARADASPTLPLQQMNPFERLRADYAGTALTTGPHPMKLMRVENPHIWRAIDLNDAEHGEHVTIGGMVICRQRPGTAKGFVFVSLEDETGGTSSTFPPSLRNPALATAPLTETTQLPFAGETGSSMHMKVRRVAKTTPARYKRRGKKRLVFSGNEAHLQILKESLRRRTPHFWNQWRKRNPRVVPDLRGLILAGEFLRGFNFARAKLDKAYLERADLAGVHLEGASLKEARLGLSNLSSVHAAKANVSGANFNGATLHRSDFRGAVCLNWTYFRHANLREANFTRAKMREATLSDADLTRTRFDGADLTRARLSDAILDETSLLGTSLVEAQVNGALIRRVKTDAGTRQRGLCVDVHVVWERQPGKMVEFTQADDIRVAQFHNIVDERGAVGKLLAATTQRVVLILGRFLPRRKQVLDRLADALGKRGKIPVIFDFPSPDDREISDTVRFIAGMSQFIVVDLTKASSVPLELQATIPDLMVPVLPIIQAGHAVFAMFSDLQRRYTWIQPTVSYRHADQLVRHVDDAIIARAELAAEQIKERRELSVRPPMSVTRLPSLLSVRRHPAGARRAKIVTHRL